MFDDSGDVVPLKVVSTTGSEFSFRYFGKRKRTTHTTIRVIKGDASTSATTVQWRTYGRKWHPVSVQANGRWLLKVRNLSLGKNKIRLRALNAGGNPSAIKRLVVIRL